MIVDIQLNYWIVDIYIASIIVSALSLFQTLSSPVPKSSSFGTLRLSTPKKWRAGSSRLSGSTRRSQTHDSLSSDVNKHLDINGMVTAPRSVPLQ